MKYLILVLVLFTGSVQALDTCRELESIVKTVMSARQAGMPEFIIKKTLALSGVKTNALKHFTAQLVMDAYAMPRVPKEGKEEAVKEFGHSLYIDCVKLINLHNRLK